MTSEYEILKSQEADAVEILRLQYAAYQSEAEIHGDFTIQPLTQTLDELVLEYKKSIVLKAVKDSVIIGSVRAYEDNKTVYIGKLMVHPDYQGKGLGKCLLAAIEKEFPNKRYELFTSGKSDRNLHLYETAGYKRFREETGDAGIEFVYFEKQQTDDGNNMAYGMCFGMMAGVMIGVLTNNIGLWLPIGLCIGIGVGTALPKKNG